ncbi:hypothetical protein DYB31_014960 [Aphanomyces astaci]|uniref:Uncharacterized protein n=1 Tax=Aphanomyces astaci TaxID=112090 RepID=A0A397FG21_APHAT|nr:hypothetical protein DYB31_014960 [Aphanomyces astaci]
MRTQARVVQGREELCDLGQSFQHPSTGCRARGHSIGGRVGGAAGRLFARLGLDRLVVATVGAKPRCGHHKSTQVVECDVGGRGHCRTHERLAVWVVGIGVDGNLVDWEQVWRP